MKTFIYSTLIAALFMAGASAEQFTMVEGALELDTKQLQFSESGTGKVTVRGCRTCEPATYAFVAGTEFRVNGEITSRAQFIELSRNGGAVYVFYDIRTKAVTRMKLRTTSRPSNRAKK